MLYNKFYITTPIFYINAEPHIGHAYTVIAADILARYHRIRGDKTFFLTGVDEHGEKIERKAIGQKQTPQKFADRISAEFQLTWDELNISNDFFIRTTDKKHKKAVQNILQYLYDKGDIYLGKYKGLYCRECEQYKNKKDLVNGKCPEHQIVPEKIEEECYMFKMSKYQNKLLKLIKTDKVKIRPLERKNEILNFYKDGLKDISFSRKNVKWGIQLPWDKSQTVYVWADAFLNYLTGLAWDGNFEKVPEMWPADLHLMSKDILRVHSTIWLAMLLALDLPLPKQLFSHGFFLINGQKMSKSIGNVIAPKDLVKKYKIDGARYLLISATPFGHDGDVSWKKFDEKYNADLANGLGNLLARSVALMDKMRLKGIKMQVKDENFQFSIFNFQSIFNNQFSISKNEFKMSRIWETYKKKFISIELDKIIDLINQQQRFLDSFITATKPWELIKNKDEKVGIIMYNVLERLRQITWMILPFMPDTAEKIWESLGINIVKEKEKKFSEAIKWGGLNPRSKIKKSKPLFPRI
ncbi:MAG: methionine--tRNA ligase [Xanthomonadaceae bacterium]|nr:methionine--tRNA ligase [Rhodospirillaceae bacterium]NIA18172.1 methionine--tRNA ligase [Xanthomonadaceae bacterium]